MSSLPAPSVVIFVANVENLTTFYRELAAMKMIGGDGQHSVLEVAGLQVVIHALRGEPRDGPIKVRTDTHIKVCLPVESIAGARARAAALGGRIKPPSAEWEAREFRACDGHDPEGNVLQVRQSATGTPRT
jgi:predicted enzyme related to lactoylglutathione lyase